MFGLKVELLIRCGAFRILFIRWMYNLDAVLNWEQPPSQMLDVFLHAAEPATNPGLQQTPSWWTNAGEPADESNQRLSAPPETTGPSWWTQDSTEIFDRYGNSQIGEFIGQGRSIGFNGLALAVARSINEESMREINQGEDSAREPLRPSSITADILSAITQNAAEKLKSRPREWWYASFVAFSIVLLEICMAFMLSYSIPTVGIGCRSGSYIIYAVLSMLPWIISLFPSRSHDLPSPARVSISMCFSSAGTVWLLFILFAAVSPQQIHICQRLKGANSFALVIL